MEIGIYPTQAKTKLKQKLFHVNNLLQLKKLLISQHSRFFSAQGWEISSDTQMSTLDALEYGLH